MERFDVIGGTMAGNDRKRGFPGDNELQEKVPDWLTATTGIVRNRLD